MPAASAPPLPGGCGTLAVHLSSESDIDGFRKAARMLLGQARHPGQVSWHVDTAAEADLFGSSMRGDVDASAVRPSDEGGTAGGADAPPPITAPAFFVSLCERTALHRDPARFGLLYRLLWRLVHEPGLRHDPLDPDRMLAEQMARAVRRDMHKMTAFVRFRPIAIPASAEGGGSTEHVAWFEPQHHIVEASAPFFARRFAQMRWAILTPERSVRWDGHALRFGPGAQRADAPSADADERLWLTYYENIFNPARLKLRMMQKEMPRRYWRNLPEATLIHTLTANSAERSGRMVEADASVPARRRPSASEALRIQPSAPVAGAPRNLVALRDSVERCRACPIGQFATQAVPGEGPLRARLMLVGEQPGDQEDLQGRPFVGPAGQLLDRALAQLGWPRERLFVTNAVRHFKYEPRGKRRMHKTPSQREADACLHWLEHELAIVEPEAAIALGATAARALLGRPVAVTRERGQWAPRADGLPVLITLHPSALLRSVGNDFEAEFSAWVEDLAQAASHWRESATPAALDGAPSQ